VTKHLPQSRYLTGNTVYRAGSMASHVGAKNKEGFRNRSRKQAMLAAMKRRLANNGR
jgi:hypothetical protein